MKKNRWMMWVAVLLTLWLAIGFTDWYQVNSFELPIFCVLTNGADDGGSGTYVGLGYSFEVEGNFTPDHPIPGMTKYIYRIFGNTVKIGIRD